METFYDGQSNCGRQQTRQTFNSRRSGNGRKMESMKEFGEQMTAAAPFIGTVLFGCLLQAFKHEWPGWKNFTASALSAGFGAWLVFQFVGDSLSPGWGIFASGMIGYSGGTLVDVALVVFRQYVESYKPKTKNEEE